MKKASCFVFLVFVMLFGAMPELFSKPTDSEKPTKKNSLHEKLIGKEKEVWEAFKRKDSKALTELLAEDYYAIEDADGEIMSKSETISSVRILDLKKYEMENLAVIEINEGAAIVRYKVRIEGALHQHAFIPHWSIVSSTWVKRSSKWQNVMYQETKISE